MFAGIARNRSITVEQVSKRGVRRAFVPATSRDQIAAAIAAHYRPLAVSLPAPRTEWMSENPYINVFDAAAFALAWLKERDANSVAWIPEAAAEARHKLERRIRSRNISHRSLRELLEGIGAMGQA